MILDGACRPLASVDVSDLAAWIASIDFEDWPQQHRLADQKIRPAMVTDLGWHGFGERTSLLVEELLALLPEGLSYNRMLSAVMPGHAIEPHADAQLPDWICRVHIPILSNDEAVFVAGGESHYLRPGTAYLVDTRIEHAVINQGMTPRVHMMFDVRRKA